jgi:predicted DNA-binding transcriptional regulator AlpA
MNAQPQTTARRSKPADVPAEADAYSLGDFCKRHSISLQTFYRLVQQGDAPDTFNVGSRVLVSKEAALRWRLAREEASAAERDAATARPQEQPSPPPENEAPAALPRLAFILGCIVTPFEQQRRCTPKPGMHQCRSPVSTSQSIQPSASQLRAKMART